MHVCCLSQNVTATQSPCESAGAQGLWLLVTEASLSHLISAPGEISKCCKIAIFRCYKGTFHQNGTVNLSVFALVGSAAVRIRHAVERKRVFSLCHKKEDDPGYDNVHRELTASARRCGETRRGGWRDHEWRNKSRDKLILDLKRLSFFFPSSKKTWYEW